MKSISGNKLTYRDNQAGKGYETFTKEGNKLCDEVTEVLVPLYRKWKNKGFGYFDIQLIMFHAVSSLILKVLFDDN